MTHVAMTLGFIRSNIRDNITCTCLQRTVNGLVRAVYGIPLGPSAYSPLNKIIWNAKTRKRESTMTRTRNYDFVIVLSPSGALAHTGILLPRENVGFFHCIFNNNWCKLTLCLYPYPISIKQLFRWRHSLSQNDFVWSCPFVLFC